MRLGRLLLLLPAAVSAGPTLRGLATGSPDDRAQATLSQMTLEEKLSLVSRPSSACAKRETERVWVLVTPGTHPSCW